MIYTIAIHMSTKRTRIHVMPYGLGNVATWILIHLPNLSNFSSTPLFVQNFDPWRAAKMSPNQNPITWINGNIKDNIVQYSCLSMPQILLSTRVFIQITCSDLDAEIGTKPTYISHFNVMITSWNETAHGLLATRSYDIHIFHSFIHTDLVYPSKIERRPS